MLMEWNAISFARRTDWKVFNYHGRPSICQIGRPPTVSVLAYPVMKCISDWPYVRRLPNDRELRWSIRRDKMVRAVEIVPLFRHVTTRKKTNFDRMNRGPNLPC